MSTRMLLKFSVFGLECITGQFVIAVMIHGDGRDET